MLSLKLGVLGNLQQRQDIKMNKSALGAILGSALLALSKKIGAKNEKFNQAFKNWFGKSVVVNANGEPLEVYHGSPLSGFTEFEQDKEGKGHPSLFFTDSWKAAVGYAGSNDEANIVLFKDFEDFLNNIEDLDGFKVVERWGHYYLKTENRYGDPLRGGPILDVMFHYTWEDEEDVINELLEDFNYLIDEDEDVGPQSITSRYPPFSDIRDLVFHRIEVYSEDDYEYPVFVWETGDDVPSVEKLNNIFSAISLKPGVYSVYLSMQNPLVLDFSGLENPPNWNNIPFPEPGMVQVQVTDNTIDRMGIPLHYKYLSSDGRKLKTRTTNEIVEWVYNEADYDGVIFLGINDAAGGTQTFGHNINVFVPFYPNQIKSVDNTGTWRIDTNNISLNRV